MKIEKLESVLIILKIPDNKTRGNFDNLFKKRKRITDINNKNKKLKKKNNDTSKNSTIDDYLNNLKKCTEKCIKILVNSFDIQENDIYNERNIFCPFHEHKETSKSPSAKSIAKKNFFICFSTNCTIRRANNENNYSSLNSITLLSKLLQITT